MYPRPTWTASDAPATNRCSLPLLKSELYIHTGAVVSSALWAVGKPLRTVPFRARRLRIGLERTPQVTGPLPYKQPKAGYRFMAGTRPGTSPAAVNTYFQATFSRSHSYTNRNVGKLRVLFLRLMLLGHVRSGVTVPGQTNVVLMYRVGLAHG